MCGICGILKSRGNINNAELPEMLGYLQERGPDHDDIYIDSGKRIGLGHSRLSIIDLDTRSNQPYRGSKNNVITFNGEIYNFKEIKRELELNGVIFKTLSDTEVILEAYQYWGIEETLNRIDGMFAFAIYNPTDQIVILARDRFGKKPFYYYKSDNSFYFSSDIRSIWSLKKNKLTIDWNSVDYYLTELSMPQPNTIWKEVKQLKPAHYTKFNLETFTFTTYPYWELPNENQLNLNIEETIEKTEVLLQKAIDKRLISDVPLGFFLSGGIDSSLVVAMAAQANSKPIKTFTISVDNAKMDESKDAERVAKRFNTEHYNIHVTADIIKNITSLIKYTGEPFADSSLIPTYLITKAIKQQVTVAISGDGGDELFGGYNDYGLAYRTDLFNKTWQNSSFNTPIIWADKLLSKVKKRENLGSYEHYNSLKDGVRLFRGMGFHPNKKSDLYEKQLLKESEGFTENYFKTIWDRYANKSLTDSLMRASMDTRLLNDYLVKIDRGSMINSVEVRSPFLDKELAEFAFSIDYKNKFSQTENKIVLRQLAQKHLGKYVSTKQKSGFGVPMHEWLRNELKPWRDELIHRFMKRKILNKEFIYNLVNQFDNNNNEHTNKIWSIICLELWFQNFYD